MQVADIARIGFASHGGSNWSLSGYEIQINGRSGRVQRFDLLEANGDRTLIELQD